MGVMACDRAGCEHIMCNRLILDGKMYICGECHEELLESRRDWPNTLTALALQQLIVEFMETAPGTHRVLYGDDLDAEFERLMGRVIE